MGTIEWWEPVVWLWFAVAVTLLARGTLKRQKEKAGRHRKKLFPGR